MDRSTASAPESEYRLADDTLFQQLDRASGILNLKTGHHLGLDSAGACIWHLLTTPDTVTTTVATMKTECEAESLTATGLLAFDRSSTTPPCA